MIYAKKSFLEMMEEEGPIIRYEDNGRKVFIFNPYYKEKDPLKTIFFDGNDGSGRPMIYRNPYVPANAEYGYDSSTYEKWQQSGFIQPNVDPYSNLQQGSGFIQNNVDPYFN